MARMMLHLKTRLSRLTLSMRFFTLGCVVMFGAAFTLGTWVSNRIEAGVTENYGSAAALYLESLTPQLPFLQTTADSLSDEAKADLRRIFVDGTLGRQVVTYKIWTKDGTVLASYDPSLEGQNFGLSDALAKAWDGSVSAEYELVQLNDPNLGTSIELPLMGIYVPIRNVQTGNVVNVIEFYRRAEDLQNDIYLARQQTWYVVSAIFLISGLLLFAIVHAGSRLIERQRADLLQQLDSNRDLQKRIALAATRSTSQADRVMQRIGLDLHDGVAQHLSLLALRLEGAGLKDNEDAKTITVALGNAMTELRAISRGLALPDIDTLLPCNVVKKAVQDHNNAYNADVRFEPLGETSINAPQAIKLALYRVTQELLANTNKHAQASQVTVTFTQTTAQMTVTVSDNGTGFDPENTNTSPDGGQGLVGIRDRLLPFGGQIDIQSQPNSGTTVTCSIPNERVQS